MSQHYLDESRENDKWSLPDVEIFYANDLLDDDGELLDAGYYYLFCFPGCMPDSSPFGPFESEREAIESAREMFP